MQIGHFVLPLICNLSPQSRFAEGGQAHTCTNIDSNACCQLQLPVHPKLRAVYQCVLSKLGVVFTIELIVRILQ